MIRQNRNLWVSLLLLATCGSISRAEEPAVKDLPATLTQIQSAIKSSGAKWVAGETSLSRLSRSDWQHRVGLGFAPVKAPRLLMMAAPQATPASVDWRDHNGNFVSGIRDQGQCGSCWAFSMTGALESYVLLNQNKPGTDLNLSEQVLISCGGAGSCNGGQLDASYLQSTGLPPASYYPYTATNGTCTTAKPGWKTHTYKIGTWGSVDQNLDAIKSALATYGPLPIAFYVYEDFMHYKGGIYSYTTGKELGGHGVLLVGYNDAEQYFIVKNSWGPGWGENGFFRIAYSQMSNSVNFGLSTIAYHSGQSSQMMSQQKAAAHHISADETLQLIEPFLQQRP